VPIPRLFQRGLDLVRTLCMGVASVAMVVLVVIFAWLGYTQ